MTLSNIEMHYKSELLNSWISITRQSYETHINRSTYVPHLITPKRMMTQNMQSTLVYMAQSVSKNCGGLKFSIVMSTEMLAGPKFLVATWRSWSQFNLTTAHEQMVQVRRVVLLPWCFLRLHNREKEGAALFQLRDQVNVGAAAAPRSHCSRDEN